MDLVNLIFKADSSEVQRAEGDLKKAASASEGLERKLSTLTGGFKALAGAIGVGMLKSWFDSIVDGQGKLNNLSAAFNTTTERMSAMKDIAAISGTTIDQVADALKRLQMAQDKSSNKISIQAEAFRQLGISTKQASGDTATLLGVVADKLAKTEDGWQKNSIVMALFGKEGLSLLEFLGDYADRSETMASVTKEMSDQADNFQRSLNKLHLLGNQFVELFGGSIVKVALALTNQFITLFNETGKLDAATRTLMANKASEWMWSLANGIATVIDYGTAVYGVIRSLADAVSIVGVSIAGLWNVLQANSLDELSGRWNALKDTLREMKDAADIRIKATILGDGSVPNTARDFVSNAQAAAAAAAAAKANAPTGDKNKVLGVGDEKVRAAAEQERLRLEALRNGLIDKANSLLGQQQDAYDRLLGKDVDKIKLEREYDDLIAKANAAGQAGLATALSMSKEKALQNQLNAKQITDTQHQLELLQQQASLENERLQLARQWDEQRKGIAWAGVVTSKSPQERAQDQFDSQYQNIKDAASTKGNALIDLANKTRVGGKPEDLERANQLEAEVNKLFEDRDVALRKLGSDFNDVKLKSDDAWAGLADGAKSFSDQLPTLNTAMATFAQGTLADFSDRLTNLFMTGKFGFTDFVKTAIAQLIKLQMQMAIMKGLQYFGIGAGTGSVLAKANGGAFDKGVEFYAAGGVFDSPTMFQHANGIGMLGEAGPEAVMPLRRGADGKLGVVASGGSGGAIQINNNVSVTVQGGNTNQQTGSAVAEAVVAKIADQRIYNATRSGGIIRQAMA